MNFRIFNYLSIINFFKAFFINQKKANAFSENELKKILKKKYLDFSGMGRTSLLLILRFLKFKNSKKREIIVQAYNLPAFIEIIKIEEFKVVFVDINKNNGAVSLKEVQSKINKNTAAVIFTNMFNSLNQVENIKKFLKKKNIPLIEDNAIYFDNYFKSNYKIYSGHVGDYVILSFNIMKNISAFYGGAVVHNSKNFKNFCKIELKRYQKFSNFMFVRQIFVYFVLKLMAVNWLYKLIFFKIIYFSNKFNITFLRNVFYPSLKFLKGAQKQSIYQNISSYSKKVIYLQLKNKNLRQQNFLKRKKNNMFLDKKLNHKIKKLNKIKLLPITDYNFQNFLDYPILVDNKDKFINFMFENNIELRKFHYFNCEKLFSRKKICKNSEYYEKHLVCIPSHPLIKKKYLNYIIEKIYEYNS